MYISDVTPQAKTEKESVGSRVKSESVNMVRQQLCSTSFKILNNYENEITSTTL